MSDTLPIPSIEMRALVGPTDAAAFDNPTGAPVFSDLPVELSDSVFDLGCGCGRLARQFLQQQPRPRKYVGIDLHAGMVRWDRDNLSSVDPNFTFLHNDVYQIGFNPTGKILDQSVPLPVADNSASLIIAWSVFTHLMQDEIGYYLRECARILKPGGVFRSTWFLFDKTYFPMMQAFQNALYINPIDLTNAVIIDRNWLVEQLIEAGLTVVSTEGIGSQGYQWQIDLRLAEPGERPVLPDSDDRPFGSQPPPLGSENAHTIGLDDHAADRPAAGASE